MTAVIIMVAMVSVMVLSCTSVNAYGPLTMYTPTSDIPTPWDCTV